MEKGMERRCRCIIRYVVLPIAFHFAFSLYLRPPCIHLLIPYSIFILFKLPTDTPVLLPVRARPFADIVRILFMVSTPRTHQFRVLLVLATFPYPCPVSYVSQLPCRTTQHHSCSFAIATVNNTNSPSTRSSRTFAPSTDEQKAIFLKAGLSRHAD